MENRSTPKPKVNFSLKTKSFRVEIGGQIIYLHVNYLEKIKQNTVVRSLGKSAEGVGKNISEEELKQLIEQILKAA